MNNYRTELRKNKEIKRVLSLLKKSSFDKHFGKILTEEILTTKFCTDSEVFVMSECFMNNLNILESSSYMSMLYPNNNRELLGNILHL